jgi:hypothetical protein
VFDPTSPTSTLAAVVDIVDRSAAAIALLDAGAVAQADQIEQDVRVLAMSAGVEGLLALAATLTGMVSALTALHHPGGTPAWVAETRRDIALVEGLSEH